MRRVHPCVSLALMLSVAGYLLYLDLTEDMLSNNNNDVLTLPPKLARPRLRFTRAPARDYTTCTTIANVQKHSAPSKTKVENKGKPKQKNTLICPFAVDADNQDGADELVMMIDTIVSCAMVASKLCDRANIMISKNLPRSSETIYLLFNEEILPQLERDLSVSIFLLCDDELSIVKTLPVESIGSRFGANRGVTCPPRETPYLFQHIHNAEVFEDRERYPYTRILLTSLSETVADNVKQIKSEVMGGVSSNYIAIQWHFHTHAYSASSKNEWPIPVLQILAQVVGKSFSGVPMYSTATPQIMDIMKNPWGLKTKPNVMLRLDPALLAMIDAALLTTAGVAMGSELSNLFLMVRTIRCEESLSSVLSYCTVER
eukprot:PhF_6_TR13258/c0_g1_i1/m.21025